MGSATLVDLDPLTLARLLEERLPALAGLRVTPLGAGLDHWAFDAGGRWLVRVPRDEDGAAALARESRLAAWLAPRLPLAIPRPELEGAPSAQLPRPFVVYAKLPGDPALQLAPAALDLPAVGAALGDLLRTLHALEPSAAAELGLPVEDAATLPEWASEASADLERCRAAGHLLDGRWEAILAMPPAAAELPLRVLHGDLAAEHVLVDGAGRPTGVIDWSDACVGDPARDLAGLVHWDGARLLSLALEAYGAPDAPTLHRARWYAACRGVADVAFGEAQRRPEYVAGGLRALGHVAELLHAR